MANHERLIKKKLIDYNKLQLLVITRSYNYCNLLKFTRFINYKLTLSGGLPGENISKCDDWFSTTLVMVVTRSVTE